MTDLVPGEKQYIFVIDTDSYAGNFEREMCAYVTGQTGECGVGEDYAKRAHNEIPQAQKTELESIVKSVMDDHGCYRPVSIHSNPRISKPNSNSVGIYFSQKPSQDLVNMMKDRAKAVGNEGFGFFEKEKVDVMGFRMITEQLIAEYRDM